MKFTKQELQKQATGKNLKNDKQWFYLCADGCSFHDARQSPQVNIHDIPLSSLLRALQERGFLRQWDRKNKRLRKVTR